MGTHLILALVVAAPIYRCVTSPQKSYDFLRATSARTRDGLCLVWSYCVWSFGETWAFLQLANAIVCKIHYFFRTNPEQCMKECIMPRNDWDYYINHRDPRRRHLVPRVGMIRVKFFTSWLALYVGDCYLLDDIAPNAEGEVDLRAIKQMWGLDTCIIVDPNHAVVFEPQNPDVLSPLAVRLLTEEVGYLIIMEQPSPALVKVRDWHNYLTEMLDNLWNPFLLLENNILFHMAVLAFLLFVVALVLWWYGLWAFVGDCFDWCVERMDYRMRPHAFPSNYPWRPRPWEQLQIWQRLPEWKRLW